MTKIYVVFDGAYSDREAIAAFTDQQAAKRAVDLRLGDEFETIVVDPSVPDLPPDKQYFGVYFRPASCPHVVCDLCPYRWCEESASYSLAKEEVIYNVEEKCGRVMCWAVNDTEAVVVAKNLLVARGHMARSE